MFAGDRSAGIGAELQDLVADPKHGFVLTGFERIEEDERVKVAVARVEHVADLEAGALADGVDLRERLGQLRARHHAIHDVEVGRQAPHRRKRTFTPFPERLAFRFVASDPHLTGAVLATHLRHPLAKLLGDLRRAVDFEQQDCAGVQRVARVRRGFDRLDGQSVHHLDRGRQDPGPHDRGHGIARGGNVRVDGHQGFLHRRQGLDLHPDPSDNAHRPLRSHQDTGQVVADRLRAVAPTDLDELPVGERNLETGDVVDRDAIEECVRASRVGRDVSSDGAGPLARGVGDVVVTVRLERLAQRQVDDARLDDSAQVVDVDLEDSIHPGEGDDDAALDRNRAAGETAGARSRRDRHPSVGADLDDLGHLLRRTGDDDDVR